MHTIFRVAHITSFNTLVCKSRIMLNYFCSSLHMFHQKPRCYHATSYLLNIPCMFGMLSNTFSPSIETNLHSLHYLTGWHFLASALCLNQISLFKVLPATDDNTLAYLIGIIIFWKKVLSHYVEEVYFKFLFPLRMHLCLAITQQKGCTLSVSI